MTYKSKNSFNSIYVQFIIVIIVLCIYCHNKASILLFVPPHDCPLNYLLPKLIDTNLWRFNCSYLQNTCKLVCHELIISSQN